MYRRLVCNRPKLNICIPHKYWMIRPSPKLRPKRHTFNMYKLCLHSRYKYCLSMYNYGWYYKIAIYHMQHSFEDQYNYHSIHIESYLHNLSDLYRHHNQSMLIILHPNNMTIMELIHMISYWLVPNCMNLPV
jgi:hypothetical protein